MVKFCVFTGGRTGSSVICDAINAHPEMLCYQELFRAVNENTKPDETGKLPFRSYLQGNPELGIEDYFSYLSDTQGASVKALGCKILLHHIEENKNSHLWEYLKDNNFKFIYLLRNPVRASLSGHIARKREIFNVRKDKQTQEIKEKIQKKVTLDPQALLHTIKSTAYVAHDWIEKMEREGIDYKIFYYEDFLVNREDFLRDITIYLKTSQYESVVEDRFVKVTPENIWECVLNSEEVKKSLVAEKFDFETQSFSIFDARYKDLPKGPTFLHRLKRKAIKLLRFLSRNIFQTLKSVSR